MKTPAVTLEHKRAYAAAVGLVLAEDAPPDYAVLRRMYDALARASDSLTTAAVEAVAVRLARARRLDHYCIALEARKRAWAFGARRTGRFLGEKARYEVFDWDVFARKAVRDNAGRYRPGGAQR